MAFTFAPDQRDTVLLALGRDDSAAWHLTEDIEAIIAAYGNDDLTPGQPDLAEELTRLVAIIATLRSALYRLPDQLRQSGLVGDLDNERLAAAGRSAERIGESLDHFTVELTVLRARIASVHQGAGTSAEKFVHALGQAYRNRMNIHPTAAKDGPFGRFYGAVTELIRRRFTDLDELCATMDETRLNRILTSANS